MRKLTPPWIDDLKPYEPGKPAEEVKRELGLTEVDKLASNENCIGPSPAAVDAATRALTNVHFYPESKCFYLRAALAEKLKVPPEMLVFGNGSHELLDLAVRTFVFDDEEVLTAHFTFVAYQLSARSSGRRLVEVPLRDMRYDLPAMAEKINDKTKLILLANPNNPTGTIFTTGELETFLEAVPKDVVVIVDEAYFEYVDDPDYPNSLQYHDGERRIMTTRTFSKIHGLAGLRIGYAVGHPDLIDALERCRLAFNVSRIAQAAALAALEDTEHIERSREAVKAGKEYLLPQFDELGITYWPSQTNFVMVELDRPSHEMHPELLKRGVIIRPMPGNYARITIGLPEQNRHLIEALHQILD